MNKSLNYLIEILVDIRGMNISNRIWFITFFLGLFATIFYPVILAFKLINIKDPMLYIILSIYFIGLIVSFFTLQDKKVLNNG